MSLQEISPLPKRSRSSTRKRRAQRAEILTSTPVKAALRDKVLSGKRKSANTSTARSKGKSKRNLNARLLVQRKPRAIKEIAEIVVSKAKGTTAEEGKVSIPNENVPEWFCLICDEKYEDPPTEDWLQCDRCKHWAHVKCALIETEVYVCDLCH